MAVDGRVIHIELNSVKEMVQLLSNTTNNINQIAKRANETGSIYAVDIDEIKIRQDEILAQEKEILRRIEGMIEAVQKGVKI
jgi:predicted phage tail protein